MLFLCWSIYKMASVEQNIDDTSLIIPVMFFRWCLLWESAQDLAHEDYYSKKYIYTEKKNYVSARCMRWDWL